VKALASGGAERGATMRGAFIRKGALTGGSIVLTNQRPINPGNAGPRLSRPCSRPRIADPFIAPRYTRFVVAR